MRRITTLENLLTIAAILLAAVQAVAVFAPLAHAAGDVGEVVDIAILPETQTVSVGDSVEVQLEVRCNEQDIASMDAFLDFDPSCLEATSITLGDSLPMLLGKNMDNTNGWIDISAGDLTPPFPSQTFIAAVVVFKVIAAPADGQPVEISIQTSGARATAVYYDGFPKLRDVSNASVVVMAACEAQDDQTATSEDEAVDIDVMANDSGCASAYSVGDFDAVTAKGASVSMNSDGTLHYNPAGKFEELAQGETQTDTFGYSLAGGAQPLTANVTVAIEGRNDAPLVENDFFTVQQGGTLQIPAPGLLANDSDIDGDSLEISKVNGKSVNVGVALALDNGTLAVNADGSFSYENTGADCAEDSFTYQISDGTEESGIYGEATMDVVGCIPSGRSHPAKAMRGESFDVTVAFAAPEDQFNSAGLIETPPDPEWIISLQGTETSPDPEYDLGRVSGEGTAYFSWYGPYAAGSQFKAVYRITVPADAAFGVHTFSGGQLEYYVADTGPFYASIPATSIEIFEGAKLSGVVREVTCSVAGGATVSLDNGASTVTDGQGAYQLTLDSARTYTVTVAKDGYGTRSQDIEALDLTQPYCLDFTADNGLIDEAPDFSYVLAGVNNWKFGSKTCKIAQSTVLQVINKWFQTEGMFALRTPDSDSEEQVVEFDISLRRIAPASVSAEETFEVVLSFVVPQDWFNSFGITELAPKGWTVAIDKSWSSPAPDHIAFAENVAEMVWYGPYEAGQPFEVRYMATAPCGIGKGAHFYSNCTLEYYIANEGPFVEYSSGDQKSVVGSLEHPWDFNGDGVVDYLDLGLFADRWLFRQSAVEWDDDYNIYQDCEPAEQLVDYLDLNIFGDHWLEQY